MKYYITILFFLSFITSWSQEGEYYILVKSNETGLPISNAVISVQESNQVRKTNTEGLFHVVGSANLTLLFSHPEYHSVALKTTSLTEKFNIVYLNPLPKQEYLSFKPAYNSFDVLSHLINNSKNKLAQPTELKAYVLEFFMLDSLLTSFNDGDLNYYINPKRKDVTVDILVNQHRFENVLKFTSDHETMGFNLNTLVENAYNLTYLQPFLNKNELDKYEITYWQNTSSNNLNKIKLTPLNKNNEALFEIEIVYDAQQMLIQSLKGNIPKPLLPYAKHKIGKRSKQKRLDRTFEIQYIKNENLFHLASLSETIKVNKSLRNGIIHDFEVINFLGIHSVTHPQPKYQKNKKFRKKSLNKMPSKFYNHFWEASKQFLLNPEQEQFIQPKIPPIQR